MGSWLGKAVNKAEVNDKYKTQWHKTNEDADYLTHEGERNRWKQSGISDDSDREHKRKGK